MQGKDALIEVTTFLARRWSGRPAITVEFSDRNEVRLRAKEGSVVLPRPDRLAGGGFAGYRLLRALLWYESMRLAHCTKILSGEHAYGQILNALETRRVEALGRRTWRGMDAELAFAYGHRWLHRPPLGTVHGRARLVEAFCQQLLFGGTKGELASNHSDRVSRAAALGSEAVSEAIGRGLQTAHLESKVAGIVKILDIDSLLTIPAALPWSKRDLALDAAELQRTLSRVGSSRSGEFERVDAKAALAGTAVRGEYEMMRLEEKRGGAAQIGMRTPERTDIDESAIYDLDLIGRLKARFKRWKEGLREAHADWGDEFDEEAYIEGYAPFIADAKHAVKAEVAILLDHSSSIHGQQAEYKKAALALGEVLSYLRVGFSMHAFSTSDRQIVCWAIKPRAQRWGNPCAKRLAQIEANGSTPLAEVYQKMQPMLQAHRPRVLLTLTDGEPTDAQAVRAMNRAIKALGIRSAAIGLGPGDPVRATAIASNLARLGYDRALAASRLEDIPEKALAVIAK